MKLLLFGANGQIGHELRRSLAGAGELVLATRTGVLGDGTRCEAADFDVPGSLPPLIERIAPDVVVNAAGYTAVDKAESDRDAAFRANADAPREIALACAQRDALLVHYSTDYVFDGAATRPYREDDPVAPLNVYGESKLAGELAIRDGGARHVILRTGWVYAAHGRNFLRAVLQQARERDELRVVADQVGTPTPASLVADATAYILASPFPQSGLWHLAASGSASRHDFAQAIVDLAHAQRLIERRPALVPIATTDHPAPARRPGFSCLDTARIIRDHGVIIPAWDAGLRRVLAEIGAGRAE